MFPTKERGIKGIVEDECTDNATMAFENMSNVASLNVPDFDDAICRPRSEIGRSRISFTDMHRCFVSTRNNANRVDRFFEWGEGSGQFVNP